ncbi:hypothetical protein [Nioella aestuarii]|uniref:hypothetical protein n=1 Tax=Nioella aestuarii TaxID=1662864 RepID=UPI003D7F7209
MIQFDTRICNATPDYLKPLTEHQRQVETVRRKTRHAAWRAFFAKLRGRVPVRRPLKASVSSPS